MVLGTLLVAVILANVILTIISSQSRLTHHQVSRIQAHYAAMAGVNYALEMLRINDPNWLIPSSPHNLCNGCAAPADINEPNLPASVTNVAIRVIAPGAGTPGCDTTAVPSVPAGVTACVQATATYTYTP